MSEENDDRNEIEEDLDLPEEDAEEVGGGLKAPAPPAGPIPIPYPNVGTARDS